MNKGTLIALSVFGIMLLIGMGYPKGATAGVSIGINFPPPPPLVIPAPPPLFVIPTTYIYFPPEVDVDIFFYHGYWYRPHQGYWYRSGSYNGKWAYTQPQHPGQLDFTARPSVKFWRRTRQPAAHRRRRQSRRRGHCLARNRRGENGLGNARNHRTRSSDGKAPQAASVLGKELANPFK